MPTIIGTYDSAAKNCVLLYDFSAGSYDGEPTINLFPQPNTNSEFQIKPSDAARAFYKLDYYQNVSGQGTFADNAPGPYIDSDSIYKYNFTTTQYDTSVTQTGGGNKHGYLINIVRGETYTASLDVYISTGHPRTGVQTVFSLNPNLSGVFATLSGSYDCSKKGTWQSINQKVFVPAAVNSLSLNSTYYEISVATKTVQHPYYGSGSSYGFVVGNTQGRTLNLYKGGTYIFTQTNSTNASDELYLSTTANSGGGANSYSNGFSYYGNKGFDGYAIFNVPYNAPTILYYNSRANGSSYVGGRINILGGYNTGNTGNTGSVGSSGSGGSSGSSGSTTSVTSEAYAVCFDPTRGILNSSYGNIDGGYILYKNMQFERNKKMFRGIIHKTQFTATSRSSLSSCIDLTGGNNNSNLLNANFDSLAYLFFAQRANIGDGGFIDLNLKNAKDKQFLIGSNKTVSFDFWFKQTNNSNSRAVLFARSSGVSGELFVENQGYPQLIFIQDKRVFFSFTSSANATFAGFTNRLIEINNLYHVVVSINLNAALGQKVKIYINGSETDVSVYDILDPPSNFSFVNISSAIKTIGKTPVINEETAGFKSNANQFYCISSYDDNGESLRSNPISVSINSLKRSVQLRWSEVLGAKGYYIYRSKSSSFGPVSLLATIDGSRTINYIDENFPTKVGTPKTVNSYNYYYDSNSTDFVDDSFAKVVFGDYPTTSGVPNYFEGYIFRIGIYNTNIDSKQAIRNYNSFLYRFNSGNSYLSREIFKPKSVIYKKVKF